MSGPLRTRLVEIGENIRSQDGRATSHPMFVVEQKRRVFGLRQATQASMNGIALEAAMSTAQKERR